MGLFSPDCAQKVLHAVQAKAAAKDRIVRFIFYLKESIVLRIATR